VEGTPFIEVVLKVGGDPVRVLVVHATSPTDRDDLRRRNRQLDQLAQRVGAVRLPTVLVGDLNTVHWDAAYARLCRRSGLITVDGGLCTWPALGPAALMPLDHVLASADIRPGEVRSFHVPGSDHRGLLADLNIAHHVP
jgi:endonuclease/exonuclease/phosphatase (EEP) superfamily protein YafD